MVCWSFRFGNTNKDVFCNYIGHWWEYLEYYVKFHSPNWKNIYCFYIFKIHCKFINLFPGTAGFLNGEIKDTWLKISHSVEKWQQISVNLTKFLQCLSCWMQGRPYTRLRSLEPGHLGLRWGEASSCKVWWTLKWPSSSCFKQCLEIYWSVGVNWCADSIGKWL